MKYSVPFIVEKIFYQTVTGTTLYCSNGATRWPGPLN